MTWDFSWRDFTPFPPLGEFNAPEYHMRFPRTLLGKTIFDIRSGNSMAGHRLNPSFFDFCDWLRSDKVVDGLKLHYIHEFVIQCHPFAWKTLAMNSGATTYEIVRTLIQANVDRGSNAGFAFPSRLPSEETPKRIRLAGMYDPELLSFYRVRGLHRMREEQLALQII